MEVEVEVTVMVVGWGGGGGRGGGVRVSGTIAGSDIFHLEVGVLESQKVFVFPNSVPTNPKKRRSSAQSLTATCTMAPPT